MAYRLTYFATLSWVGDGIGPMGGQLSVLPGSELGGAQSMELANTPGGQQVVGGGTSGAITAANITTITNAMAADISAQLNLTANLAKAQGFATGGN